jgi:hypothetical protein
MDLITGRQVATGGHVTLLVSLSTLQGGDEPGEIPGLGFVAAQEARDIVAGADEIRRTVVDAAGQLVGTDTTVVRPPAQEEPEQEPLLTDQVEPEPVGDDEPEHTVSDEDWLAEELGHPGWKAHAEWLDHLAPVTGDETPEQARAQEALRALRTVLRHQEETTGRRIGTASVRVLDDGTMAIHYPEDPWDPPPDDGGGGNDPPQPPTEPLPAGYVDDHEAMRLRDAGLDLPSDPRDAAVEIRRRWCARRLPSWGTAPRFHAPDERVSPEPTLSDLEWEEQHPSAVMAHALIQAELAPVVLEDAPPGGWPTPKAAPAPWSAEALQRTIETLTSRPVTPAPPDSTGYLYRGSLARFVKLRDQTCRFPSCNRLAERCDTDHRIPWPAGPTSVGNATSLCEHHHQAKHALIELTKRPDGSLRWTLPTGHWADVPPRRLLRGW